MCEQAHTHGPQHGTKEATMHFLFRTGREETGDLLPVCCGGVFEDARVG